MNFYDFLPWHRVLTCQTPWISWISRWIESSPSLIWSRGTVVSLGNWSVWLSSSRFSRCQREVWARTLSFEHLNTHPICASNGWPTDRRADCRVQGGLLSVLIRTVMELSLPRSLAPWCDLWARTPRKPSFRIWSTRLTLTATEQLTSPSSYLWWLARWRTVTATERTWTWR